MTSSDWDLSKRSAPGGRAKSRRLAISDVHGYVGALKSCLEKHGVVDASQAWVGGTTKLWFLGDYLDRGRHGLEVINLVRRLERNAVRTGGSVKPLLGNHELQFLAALYFGDRELADGGRTTWRQGWLRYGGIEEELREVDDATVDWMSRLALVDLDNEDLLVHSDTDGYLRLGASVEEINAAGREILASRDVDAWALLHGILTQRNGFRGDASPDRVLSQLGGRRVVHGHSSLIGEFGLEGEEAGTPHVYASERAVAIDGGVFEGGALLVAYL